MSDDAEADDDDEYNNDSDRADAGYEGDEQDD